MFIPPIEYEPAYGKQVLPISPRKLGRFVHSVGRLDASTKRLFDDATQMTRDPERTDEWSEDVLDPETLVASQRFMDVVASAYAEHITTSEYLITIVSLYVREIEYRHECFGELSNPHMYPAPAAYYIETKIRELFEQYGPGQEFSNAVAGEFYADLHSDIGVLLGHTYSKLIFDEDDAKALIKEVSDMLCEVSIEDVRASLCRSFLDHYAVYVANHPLMDIDNENDYADLVDQLQAGIEEAEANAGIEYNDVLQVRGNTTYIYGNDCFAVERTLALRGHFRGILIAPIYDVADNENPIYHVGVNILLGDPIYVTEDGKPGLLDVPDNSIIIVPLQGEHVTLSRVAVKNEDEP